MANQTISNPCSIAGCEKTATSKTWCKPHYDAWYRHGDPLKYRDRSEMTLWDKLQEIGWTATVSGCFEYNGNRNALGYGMYRNENGPLLRVHRLVYQYLVGNIDRSEVIMHRCDNPPCCNPAHLQKGTQAENIQDMIAKGRNFKADWTHCPNGHVYTGERQPKANKNRCRECSRERSRRYHQRKKENANGVAA